MRDAVTFEVTKRQGQRLLRAIDTQGLHDPHVNMSVSLIREPQGGYALQVSRWDTRVIHALRQALGYDDPD